MIGAARLDARIFEEIEADVRATGQAMAVIVLSSVAAGVGVAGFGARPLIVGALTALVAWIAWAALTYLIGTHILQEPQTRSNLGELLRTTGFASAPGMLRVLGVLPGLNSIVYFATSAWMLAAMVVGVRQALDFTTTGRAVAVCVVGWILSLTIALVVGIMFGPIVQ
jgi:Yip1 domain